MDTDLLIELTRRYTEPHREYHGMEHIGHMLAVGREHDLDDVQVMAIWFHDAIYDPTAKDNEERSAQLAEDRLAAAGWSPDDVAAVAAIVRDTATHVPTSLRAHAVIDLDLMGLGAPTEIYDRMSDRIRSEYSMVEDAAFAAGTIAFVDRFLARTKLFYTEWGKPLEQPARENLARLRRRWESQAREA